MTGQRFLQVLVAGLVLAALVVIVVIVGWPADRDSPPAAVSESSEDGKTSVPPIDETGVVDHFIDGDTLDVVVRGQSLRIRLLNIDAPETYPEVECKGPEAAARLRQLAPLGSTVGLSYDVERTDQYGRTLAALILADGRNASEVLAAEGLGEAVLFEPNDRDFEAVRAAEAEAERAGLGIYSSAC